jgi:hypothetical protein
LKAGWPYDRKPTVYDTFGTSYLYNSSANDNDDNLGLVNKKIRQVRNASRTILVNDFAFNLYLVRMKIFQMKFIHGMAASFDRRDVEPARSSAGRPLPQRVEPPQQDLLNGLPPGVERGAKGGSGQERSGQARAGGPGEAGDNDQPAGKQVTVVWIAGRLQMGRRQGAAAEPHHWGRTKERDRFVRAQTMV